MKSIRVLFATALLLWGLGAGSAFAQEIIVANGTGFTLHQLGLIDSNADGDAQDLLGSDTLASGEGLKVNISGSPKGWELIAVDGEGGQVNWQNLDLTGVSKITLHADGTATVEYPVVYAGTETQTPGNVSGRLGMERKTPR